MINPTSPEAVEIRRAFASWVHAQDPNQTYEFQSLAKCAVGQYTDYAHVVSATTWDTFHVTHARGKDHPMKTYNTFGDLAPCLNQGWIEN